MHAHIHTYAHCHENTEKYQIKRQNLRLKRNESNSGYYRQYYYYDAKALL